MMISQAFSIAYSVLGCMTRMLYGFVRERDRCSLVVQNRFVISFLCIDELFLNKGRLSRAKRIDSVQVSIL